MGRTPSRSHILFPGLVFLALFQFFIPEAHVENLRSGVISLLSPVLNMASAASRSNEPRPALIKVERPKLPEQKAEPKPENHTEELESLIAENVQLYDEIKRLKAHSTNDISLPLPQGIKANVIARKILWQEPILALNCGEAQGVRMHAGVLHRGAVVGRIISLGRQASTMALLTHRGMSISARLLDCRIEGVLRGQVASDKDEGQERHCTLSVVGREINAKAGEQVVTSGYDGVFPPGLLLGTVSEIKKTGDVQWEISVRPACNENAVESVHVVTAVLPEVPWPAAPAVKKR
jgi:rod shape-determining protein MreC